MRTRSSSNLHVVSSNPLTLNPKRRNRRRSKQPFILEESPIDTMVDKCTMAELLRAPTEGSSDLKRTILMITSVGVARWWLEKEPLRFIHTWEDLVSKFINEFFPPSRTTNLRNEISNFQQQFDELFHEAWDRYTDLLRACPYHGFTKFHQLDTFYNALNPADHDSLNAAAGGNLLERLTQDVLTLIENKSKVCNSQNKSVVSQVKSCDVNSNSSSEIAKLTLAVNHQMSVVTAAMTTILKQFQATSPPAFVKAIKEICVTCGGAHPYYQCMANQDHQVFLNLMCKITKADLANLMDLTVAPLSNQTNEIKNMMASLLQMNTASTSGSGSLPINTVANPKGELKDITTRIGIFLDGPTVPTPPQSLIRRVPLILGRPFLRTARALIDVHGEEMILHFLKDLFSNQPSGNPIFSSHLELTLSEVKNDIFDSKGGNVLPEKLLDLYSTKDLHPPLHFDIESDLKEIEFLLHQDIDSSLKDSIDQCNLADIFIDSMTEMFTDEHASYYSSPPIFDEYDDDFLEVESDTKNVFDDPFDSKGEKIKVSKLLIDELDLPCNFLLPSKYDSFIAQDLSRVDALPSTNNEDKVFNRGILIQEKPFEIITRVVQDKKLAIFNASLVLKDFDPPFYEPLFSKEVPRSKMLLLFSSENEEKVFKPWIHTSEKVHSSCIPELSHQGYKIFKINQIVKSPMNIFLFYGKDTHILAVPCLYFYPLDQFKYGGIRSS
nr:reverse transcriptase domain-containing protein [Tanacetum cinerariifolium]